MDEENQMSRGSPETVIAISNVRMPGRLTPLSDRNAVLDELMSLTRNVNSIQLDAQRIRDELSHRLTVVDSRLLSCESTARQVEKKESSLSATVDQMRAEFDLRIKEISAELLLLRRQGEGDTRAVLDSARQDARKHEERLGLLESAVRTLGAQLLRAEEARAGSEAALGERAERRAQQLQEAAARETGARQPRRAS